MTGKCSEGKHIILISGHFNFITYYFYNYVIFRLLSLTLIYYRHNDIESISKEYAIEKIELEKALSELTEVEKRKADLLEEKRLEEVIFTNTQL